MVWIDQVGAALSRCGDILDTVETPRPEVLFVLANHQPSSKRLRNELATLPAREHADYYITSVTYAGYALFADNLIPLDDFVAQNT